MVRRVQHTLKKRWLTFVGACLLLLAGITWAVDWDANLLPDDWEITQGYSTNGYRYPDMVIWAQMDVTNPSTVVDRSANNRNGSITGFRNYTSGLYNNALTFSNSAVAFPVDSTFDFTNSWTVSLWFQGGSTTQKIPLAQWTDINGNNWTIMVNNDGTARMEFINNGVTQTVAPTIGASNIADQQWHHIAGTYRRTPEALNTTLYVDGDLEAQGTITNGSINIAQSFSLGSVLGFDYLFSIDEMRLYNKTLTATEILQLPATYSDEDGDGLTTAMEYQKGTNPHVADTDGDGILDGQDYRPLDADPLPNIPSLRLWLRADKGVVADGTGLVSSWNDQSGWNNHATQSLSTNKPKLVVNAPGGMPSIKFNGTNHLATVAFNWTNNFYTYFIVWRKEGTALSTHTLFNRAQTFTVAGNNFQFISANGNTVGTADAKSTGADVSSISLFTTNAGTSFSYVSVTRDDKVAKGTKIYVNGLFENESVNLVTTNAVGTSTYPFYIGGWNNTRANASIAEFIVYDRPLSLTERVDVEIYLRNRYGFTPPTLAAPIMSPAGGTFTTSKMVTMTSAVGTTIRYTTDGSNPTTASTPYTAPIPVNSTITIKAAAFQTGYTTSPVVTGNFTGETGGAFTNLVSNGLKFWVASDRGITASGNAISSWEDQSGYGNHALQVTNNFQPQLVANSINGKPAVRFDGTNYYLTANSPTWTTNDYSYFIVWKKSGTATSSHTLFNRASTFTSAGNNFQVTSANGNTVATADAVGTGADASSTSLFTTNNGGTYAYMSVTRADRTAKGTKVYVNGLLEGESSASVVTNAVTTNGYKFYLGGWNTTRANASIAEILVYDTTLSPVERTSMEQYLRDRYGFAIPTLNQPIMTPYGGTFVSNVVVQLATQPGATVRYTTDGSVPTATSTIYTAPLALTSTTTVNAKAFQGSYAASPMVSGIFTIETASLYSNVITNGLKFWLMSDRGTQLNGTSVTNWLDQSGYGNSALQITNSLQPKIISNAINGKPVIKFDGTNHYMTATSPAWASNDYSYFMVFKKDGNSKTVHMPLTRATTFTSATGSFQLLSTNGVMAIVAESPGTGADTKTTTLVGNSTTYSRVSVVRQDKTANGTKIYLDGNLEGSSPAPIFTNAVTSAGCKFYVGAWNTGKANMSLAEVLVYDKALSDAERQSLDQYLQQRYFVDPNDTDADGLPDAWELQYFGNLTQGPNVDSDGDGLTNAQERTLGTNPTLSDTDGDGVSDGSEVARGTDPLNSSSKNVFIYTDSAVGNDSYDGIAPAVGGGHGPKQSLQGAVNAAISGDTIDSAAGVYAAGTLNLGTKQITLKPNGTVKVQ